MKVEIGNDDDEWRERERKKEKGEAERAHNFWSLITGIFILY